MRILIVEDDVRLASTMKDLLVHAKYFVDVVHDGETGLDYARSDIYDGLILDMKSATVDGMLAVRTLRTEEIKTPVLLLSGKNKSTDQENDFDLGTGHYLTKPFQKEDLLCSIKSLLQPQEDELLFGDLTLSIKNNTLACDGETIPLSARELELARLLFTHKEDVVPKETIFLKIWGYDSEAESNVVEAYVSFLRRKMRHLKSAVGLVAVRRKGYRLNLDHEESKEPKK